MKFRQAIFLPSLIHSQLCIPGATQCLTGTCIVNPTTDLHQCGFLVPIGDPCNVENRFCTNGVCTANICTAAGEVPAEGGPGTNCSPGTGVVCNNLTCLKISSKNSVCGTVVEAGEACSNAKGLICQEGSTCEKGVCVLATKPAPTIAPLCTDNSTCTGGTTCMDSPLGGKVCGVRVVRNGACNPLDGLICMEGTVCKNGACSSPDMVQVDPLDTRPPPISGAVSVDLALTVLVLASLI